MKTVETPPTTNQPEATKQSLFICSSANETIERAILQPLPKPLFENLWYENEVSCLFSDSNLGKSILAVQIAHTLSLYEKVMYFDFELSDKQFQLRYTSDNGVDVHKFSDNLIRCTIDPFAITDENFEEAVLSGIKSEVENRGVKVIIIDNLTYLCIAAEKGDIAGRLMMSLIQMKRLYNLSILVLAHTPKRPLTNPITQNDLAGSKKLVTFFDSVFAIGQSNKDSSLRYIKQIKCRNGSFTLDSENVAVYLIEKLDECFLSFREMGFSSEKEHLKDVTKKESDELIAVVIEGIESGKSYQQVADEQRISKSKVQRIMRKHNKG